MVRYGIRGAVIALVCGSAVATAMGVLSKSGMVGSARSNNDDVSQRLRYQYEQSASRITRVASIPGPSQGTAGYVPMPGFMTGDTAGAVGASSASLAALDSTHPSANTPKATTLAVSPLSAAARGGSSGGFAYGYSSKLTAQSGLDADLAQYAADSRRPRLGSDAPFSSSAAPRSGAGSAVAVSDLTGTSDDSATNPETNPGTTNSTLPNTAQSNAGPVAPVVRDPVNQQVATAGDIAPASSAAGSPVPAPGAASLLGLGGIAMIRRRR